MSRGNHREGGRVSYWDDQRFEEMFDCDCDCDEDEETEPVKPYDGSAGPFTLRGMLPSFRAHRGGITFLKPPEGWA